MKFFTKSITNGRIGDSIQSKLFQSPVPPHLLSPVPSPIKTFNEPQRTMTPTTNTQISKMSNNNSFKSTTSSEALSRKRKSESTTIANSIANNIANNDDLSQDQQYQHSPSCVVSVHPPVDQSILSSSKELICPDLDVVLEGIGGTHSGNVLLNDLITLHALCFLAQYGGNVNGKEAIIFHTCCDILDLLYNGSKILVAGEKRLGKGQFIPSDGVGVAKPVSRADALRYVVRLFLKSLSLGHAEEDDQDYIKNLHTTLQQDFREEIKSSGAKFTAVKEEDIQDAPTSMNLDNKRILPEKHLSSCVKSKEEEEDVEPKSKRIKTSSMMVEPQEANPVTKKLCDCDVAVIHSGVSEISSAYKYRPGNKKLRELLDKGCCEVSFSCKSSTKRAKLAVSIVNQLRQPPTTSDEDTCGRFLLRSINGCKWTELDFMTCCEIVTICLWRKTGDKSNIIGAARVDEAEANTVIVSPVPPSSQPVPEPTEHDVLFGRGGMTNHHPGNRRFRDIISLHRPDYISAIKIDKPKVARRIVQAIRAGSPPGRFLKRNARDGLWYDVGDRTAAEKASQALRERPQAERYEKVVKRREEERRKKASVESNLVKPNIQPKKPKTMPSSSAASEVDFKPIYSPSPPPSPPSPQLPTVPAEMSLMKATHAGPCTLVYPPVFVPTLQPQPPKLPSFPSLSSNNIKQSTTQSLSDQVRNSISIREFTSALSSTQTSQQQQRQQPPARRESPPLPPPSLPPPLSKMSNKQKVVQPIGEQDEIIITDHDILCGRGGLTNHHAGNKRFRDIVSLHRSDYIRAPKMQKPAVARLIVSAIRNANPSGRFLKKDPKTGCWYDIGDKCAAEKASQALREKTVEERITKTSSTQIQQQHQQPSTGGKRGPLYKKRVHPMN